MLKKLSDIFEFKADKKYPSARKKTEGDSFNFLALIHKWPDIVGPKLSKVTIPLKNNNNTLTILTEHPAYSQSLSFLEQTLKKKIYSTFPQLKDKIDRFYFKVSTEHFVQERERLITRSQMWSRDRDDQPPGDHAVQKRIHKHNPKVKQLREEASKHFSHIQDEELRDSMISLFIQTHID